MKYLIALLLLLGGGLLIANKENISAKYQQGLTIGSVFRSACPLIDSATGKGYALTAATATTDCPYQGPTAVPSATSTAGGGESCKVWVENYPQKRREGAKDVCYVFRECVYSKGNMWDYAGNPNLAKVVPCSNTSGGGLTATTSPVSQDVTLTLSLSGPAGSGKVVGAAVGKNIIKKGSTVQLTAVPAKGFEFKGWSEPVKTSYITLSLQKDAAITAFFGKAGGKVAVQTIINGDGTGSLSGIPFTTSDTEFQVESGTTFNLAAVPDDTSKLVTVCVERIGYGGVSASGSYRKCSTSLKNNLTVTDNSTLPNGNSDTAKVKYIITTTFSKK